MNEYKIIFEMIKGQYRPEIDIQNNKLHENWACSYVVNKKLAEKVELVDSKDKVERKVKDMMLYNPNNIAELKRDILCYEYGNVFIEVESHGKPSGIITTKSNWWFTTYYLKTGMMKFGIAETENVRKLIDTGKYSLTHKGGGDKIRGKKMSDGFKVPWPDFDKICFYRDEMDAIEYIKQIGLENELNRRLQITKQNSTW